MLKEAHSSASGGYFGVKKTLEKVREKFYWLGSRIDVTHWCRRRSERAPSEAPTKRTRERMQQYNIGTLYKKWPEAYPILIPW